MRVKRLLLLSGCLAAGVLSTAMGFRAAAMSFADEKGSSNLDVISKKALLQAAKDAYEGMLKRRQTDPSVSNDIEYIYRWSRRWLEAERALSDAKEKRLAAYQAHRDRMQSLNKLQVELVKNGMASSYELAAAKFFRIEAEQWLDEEKAK